MLHILNGDAMMRPFREADLPGDVIDPVSGTGSGLSGYYSNTDFGRSCLGGEVDFFERNNPEYWLGGVHLEADNIWRWDELRSEFHGK